MVAKKRKVIKYKPPLPTQIRQYMKARKAYANNRRKIPKRLWPKSYAAIAEGVESALFEAYSVTNQTSLRDVLRDILSRHLLGCSTMQSDCFSN